MDSFHDLIQSVFWVIQKVTYANIRKAVHDIIIIPVLFDPLNLETQERLRKKLQKLHISRTKTEDGKKTHFL